MKLFGYLAVALASAHASNALSIPEIRDISVRDAIPDFLDFDAPVNAVNDLFKRKGGGGKGGSSGSSGVSSSGGSSGSRPASGSSGSSGSSSSGSRGVTPTYGGGRFYGGGATTAYSAGRRSPRGISPFLFASPFLIFPGLWLYNAYAYRYPDTYTFRNATTGRNETKPVVCLCQQYQPCGCDENSDSSYLNGLIGDGRYSSLNKSLVTVSQYRGKSTIVINGTLPNGTTNEDTTAGDTIGGAAGLAIEWSGYWIMAATVLFTVWGL